MGKANSRLSASKFEGLTKGERRALISRNRSAYAEHKINHPDAVRDPRRRAAASASSDVTVTTRDGATYTVPAYTPAELLRIAPERLTVPDGLRQRILKRDGGACRYCGKSEGPFHLDHVVPVAHGGRTNFQNLVTACATCNLRKGVRHWTPLPLPRRK